MGDLLTSYTSLSASSSRAEVSKVLVLIINAPPFNIDQSTRAKLIDALLEDLKSRGSECRLKDDDAAKALLTLKTLGRSPNGAEKLSSESTLLSLISLAEDLKDNVEASCEALRCIANAMLLFPSARTTFTSDTVNGGEVCVRMLIEATNVDKIFILARILFFATAQKVPFVVSLVEDHNISEIVSAKLDITLTSCVEGGQMAKEAITDLLKLIFNLLLQYPKMVECEPQAATLDASLRTMGDYWSSKLDGFLTPLIRVYHALPLNEPTPLVSPLSNVIHCLIAIPTTNERLKPILFGRADGALPTSKKPADIVTRTTEIIARAFEAYLPSNKSPDDESVRGRISKLHPDSELDDILSPIVILLALLCLGDPSARNYICDWVVPPNLDRDPDRPLDERPDFLGRCLRLLGSVYHSRMKVAVGEMLYAMCDKDAGVLSSKVGYGHVAGFLFEKGVMSAPDPSTASNSAAPSASIEELPDEDSSEMTFSAPEPRQINPITGTYMPETKSNPMEGMSEEEKEREMEKLFVLFDRMEKTGALQPEQNPVRKAIQKSMEG